MKLIILFCFLLCTFIIKVQGGQKYTTKYDDMNIEDVLKSDRLLNNYVKCLMDEGPCTPDGSELKRVLTEALDTDCENCSEKQKENSEKVVVFLLKNKPEIWKRLEKRYDPEGKYRIKYANRIPTTTEKA